MAKTQSQSIDNLLFKASGYSNIRYCGSSESGCIIRPRADLSGCVQQERDNSEAMCCSNAPQLIMSRR